jgi:hypothetical protein
MSVACARPTTVALGRKKKPRPVGELATEGEECDPGETSWSGGTDGREVLTFGGGGVRETCEGVTAVDWHSA